MPASSPKALQPSKPHLSHVFSHPHSLVSKTESVHERHLVRGRVGGSARRSKTQGEGPESLQEPVAWGGLDT